MREIYLDNASTTQVYPAVVKEMNKFFLKEYGNPSSIHHLGKEARREMDKVRAQIAKEINCKPWEIIFTSGATESNNLALQGLAKANRKKKKIIISAIEHASIISVCDSLKSWGYSIVKIPVNKEGLLDLIKLEKEIDSNTLIVSIIHANNVIGTLQDIEKIGKLCKQKSTIFHTDAAQSFCKEKIDVRKMNIDLLSGSAHKIHGPKGVGFLYVKEEVGIEPIIYGGGQERDVRSGTENVPGIMGLGKAVELSVKVNKNKIMKIRDLFIRELEKIGGKINGSKDKRLWNNIHVSFPINDEQGLVIYLCHKNIYVSSGSACDTKKEKEDQVLKAIGVKSDLSNIRISLDENVKEKDVMYVVKEVKKFLLIK